jgi:hypothetical protein
MGKVSAVISFSISELRAQLSLLDDKVVLAERAVEDAQRAVVVAQDALVDARTKRDGASTFIDMLEAIDNVQDAPMPPRAGSDGISAAVLAVLNAHPEGVRVEDIPRLAVQQGGPELEPVQVRSAVKYLGRRGDAVNVRRGFWRPKTTASTNTDGPAEAGPSDEAPPPVLTEVGAG